MGKVAPSVTELSGGGHVLAHGPHPNDLLESVAESPFLTPSRESQNYAAALDESAHGKVLSMHPPLAGADLSAMISVRYWGERRSHYGERAMVNGRLLSDGRFQMTTQPLRPLHAEVWNEDKQVQSSLSWNGRFLESDHLQAEHLHGTAPSYPHFKRQFDTDVRLIRHLEEWLYAPVSMPYLEVVEYAEEVTEFGMQLNQIYPRGWPRREVDLRAIKGRLHPVEIREFWRSGALKLQVKLSRYVEVSPGAFRPLTVITTDYLDRASDGRETEVRIEVNRLAALSGDDLRLLPERLADRAWELWME